METKKKKKHNTLGGGAHLNKRQKAGCFITAHAHTFAATCEKNRAFISLHATKEETIVFNTQDRHTHKEKPESARGDKKVSSNPY